jgi:hypothetical protein
MKAESRLQTTDTRPETAEISNVHRTTKKREESVGRDYTKIRAWQLKDELVLVVCRYTQNVPGSDI